MIYLSLSLVMMMVNFTTFESKAVSFTPNGSVVFVYGSVWASEALGTTDLKFTYFNSFQSVTITQDPYLSTVATQVYIASNKQGDWCFCNSSSSSGRVGTFVFMNDDDRSNNELLTKINTSLNSQTTTIQNYVKSNADNIIENDNANTQMILDALNNSGNSIYSVNSFPENDGFTYSSYTRIDSLSNNTITINNTKDNIYSIKYTGVINGNFNPGNYNFQLQYFANDTVNGNFLPYNHKIIYARSDNTNIRPVNSVYINNYTSPNISFTLTNQLTNINFNFIIYIYVDDDNFTFNKGEITSVRCYLSKADNNLILDAVNKSFNVLTDSGGRDQALKNENQQFEQTANEYHQNTDTSQQYEYIEQVDLDFSGDKNPFLQFASATTFFTTLVSSLFIKMGTMSTVLTLFLTFALVAMVLGIVNHISTK